MFIDNSTMDIDVECFGCGKIYYFTIENKFITPSKYLKINHSDLSPEKFKALTKECECGGKFEINIYNDGYSVTRKLRGGI